jgi:hypothetical protein
VSLFKPKGEKSQREMLFEAIRDKPSDQLIPYTSLPGGREVAMGLRDSVARTMEREQQRTVVCVRGEGWKIVRGSAQVDVASNKRRQASRRMGRAAQVIQTVDRRDMSAQEQVRADAELIHITAGYSLLRGMASRKLGVAEVIEWREQQSGGASAS